MSQRSVGILGGTFDPVHFGHLAAAEAALACAGLETVVLVPAGSPPHKPPAQAPSSDRLEMCRLAVAERPKLEVSDLELRRSGPSYTLDTLTAFRRERPHDHLRLILGWDAAREIRTWHRPDEVMRLAPLIVLSRPTLPAPDQDDLVHAGLDPASVTLCTESTPDIRATEVRRLAAQERPLDGLVPEAVAEYIRRHKLYRSP